MQDPDPEAVRAIQSESDLENASEDVQNAFRSSDPRAETSYASVNAIVGDEDGVA
jgi:hypothetical protein